jgi:hypothetical protein
MAKLVPLRWQTYNGTRLNVRSWPDSEVAECSDDFRFLG